MRIAHVIATFPPDLGGMGRVAYDECKKLKEAGHEVTVFCLKYSGQKYEDYALPFKVVRVRPFIKAGDAGFVPQLFFKLKGFDIVHLHYPWYGGAEWVWFAKLIRGQRYVVTYHMDAAPVTNFKLKIKRLYDFIFAKLILTGAEKVLIVDPEYFNQSEWGRAVTADNIVELPNAVDMNVYKANTTAERSGLLFVGNLLPVKRLDLLLRAIVDLSSVTLTVVGGGYEEAAYKKMATELGLSQRIKFLGRISDPAELAKYYSRAEATIIPSDAESSSLVALEAMACECAVVASRLPSIQSKITDGQEGYFFEPGSVEDLKRAIEQIFGLSDEERKAMGERGRKKVEAFYSLNQHASKLESIYKSI